MTRRDATDVERAGEEASRRFVRVDAGEPGAGAELAQWLAERPEHERGLERVELAVHLARRLAAEAGSALHREAEVAARVSSQQPRRSNRLLAWGGAMAAALFVAAYVVRDGAPPAIAPEDVTIEAARDIGFDAPSNPVSVLPTGVVVDASTVAVLPFSASGGTGLAEDLERDVAAALREVPGLYVIADRAVQPYAATELEASEVGGQLGARGLVDAAVELADGRVRVEARLRESATGATLWQARFDRPVAELRAVRDEIAQNVAATMFDSGLRAQSAAPRAEDSAPASSKPFQQ